MTMTREIKFHVFTDGHDEWFSANEIDSAVFCYYLYAKRHANARLYIEIYHSTKDMENDIVEDENCLLAQGEFPG